MRYLICYSWNNTRGNHAGFQHICILLKKKYPKDYTVITDYATDKRRYVPNMFLNRCINSLDRRYHSKMYKSRVERMLENLQDHDEVFLMEYLHHTANQIKLAKTIRETKPKVKVYGLVHLTPSVLEGNFTKDEYSLWTQPIDAYLTLGSSLTSFLLEKTNHAVPVYTLFHPVDSDYFNPLNVKKNEVTVIALGYLQRNYTVLEDIVKRMPQVKFVLCAGNANISSFSFEKYTNVTVHGYMPESELRHQLSKADISLNVMDDTVGSNVITISMAMHLALVVSDVGSIRDYCAQDNALLCNGIEDFVKAISFLSEDLKVLRQYQEASGDRVKMLSIERFHDLINGIS